MRVPCFLVLLGICALSLPPSGLGDEKNGVSLAVAKTTLDKNDMRSGFSYDRIDRTQGLKVTIKNESFKDMPEGELNWEILVRRYLSNQIVSYKGTEKLKALKTSESQEVTIGAAEITGWRDGAYQEKDKTEWQISVKQAGVEMIKSQSTSSFDSLAKRAVKAPPVPGH